VLKLDNINIQKIRIELGMSQAELAKKVGVSRQTINMIETGKIKKPKKETLFAIAKVLMVDVDELYKKPT
jgi:putative transcriptional regulator